MNNFRLKTPVAFLIFNRSDSAQKVFEEIRRSKPPKLLVVADGPRENVPEDRDKCLSARAVIDTIDWECEIFKNYADTNLGCKRRVSSGVDWIFDTVEEAIILEDDCVPHPSFFRFCEEMLQRYRDDERIMMISGDNFQFGRKRSQFSYYFSCYSHIWGWASWRRAWKLYDVTMEKWPKVRDAGQLNDWFSNRRAVAYWEEQFEKTYAGEIDSWDYQWAFTCWLHGGLTVLPSVNLISNIGFSQDATHTKSSFSYRMMNVEPMTFPLHHPHNIDRDIIADNLTQKVHYSPSIYQRAINKFLKLVTLFQYVL